MDCWVPVLLLFPPVGVSSTLQVLAIWEGEPDKSSLNLGRSCHHFEIATAHENTPGNPRELVGERDG